MTAGDPTIVRIVIPAGIPAPVKRPPSSREIARRRAKAEAEARAAVEAKALARQVQPGLRAPPGRLFALDAEGLVLRGPLGGLGASPRIIETLGPFAAGGRHPLSVLAAAGGWKDEAAVREALAGLGGRLGAVGLRLDRRKSGWRIARAKGE